MSLMHGVKRAVVTNLMAWDTNNHSIFTLSRTSIKEDWRVNWEKSVARALQALDSLEDVPQKSVSPQSSSASVKEPKISKTENKTIHKGKKISCV